MPTTESTPQPLRLFFSYAHEDKNFRDELQVHLSGLQKRGIISDWYDGGITAGSKWSEEISRNLEAAQIILLLISPDFIASKYCFDYEMKRALEKHEAGESRVIPVLIRDVDDWRSFAFAELQVVPEGAKPVEKWALKNDAWVDVVRNIRLACQEMLKIRQASEASEVKRTKSVKLTGEGVVLRGNSVRLVNASAEIVGQLERIREISMDVQSGTAAGVPASHLTEDRREARRNIDEALHVMNRVAEDRGQAVEDLRAGDVHLSRIDLLLKKAILLHAEAEETNLDDQLPEEHRKAAYTAKLKESYDLLREANRNDPVNTEVLLQMAQLLVELTPDDPNDEQRLLNRIRKLLDEPKSDAEKFRLARATYMLAMGSVPPQIELLREPRAIFEKLGRMEWVQQCDQVLKQTEFAAEEREAPQEDEHTPHETVTPPVIPPQSPGWATPPAPPLAQFQPAGQWQFQINDPVGSVLHLNFNPNGSFQGSQTITMLNTMLQIAGRWGFNPFNRMLQLQGLANGFQPFMLGINIQGPQNNGFHGIGTDGYIYFISRGGTTTTQQGFNPGFGSNFDFSNFGF